MKLSRSALKAVAAGGVLALMVTAGGAGYALASGTTIHACAAEHGGALRSCSFAETNLFAGRSPSATRSNPRRPWWSPSFAILGFRSPAPGRPDHGPVFAQRGLELPAAVPLRTRSDVVASGADDLGASHVLVLLECLCIEEDAARSDAGPADRLTDRAVTVMASMTRALLGTGLAGANAGLEQAVNHDRVPVGRPRKHSRCDVA
jgi:hypothetical protein